MFTLLKEFPIEELQPRLADEFELETAFEYKNMFILFLTQDTPHEETLTIVLLNDNYHEIEKIDLYAPYTPGIFNMANIEQNAITFTFWSEQTMSLRYSEGKKYRWQHKGLSNVFYQGGFLKPRHLILEA